MQLLPEELNHILHWPLLSHVTDGASVSGRRLDGWCTEA